MFNITNHQGKASQSHSEISPHTCQNVYLHFTQKQTNNNNNKTQITNDGKDVEKRNPPKLLVGMEIGAATMENSMKFSEKETKNKTTVRLVNSTQTNLKKKKKLVQKDACIPMFIAALFIVVKIWK